MLKFRAFLRLAKAMKLIVYELRVHVGHVQLRTNLKKYINKMVSLGSSVFCCYTNHDHTRNPGNFRFYCEFTELAKTGSPLFDINY